MFQEGMKSLSAAVHTAQMQAVTDSGAEFGAEGGGCVGRGLSRLWGP
jgi:hypothetical protein